MNGEREPKIETVHVSAGILIRPDGKIFVGRRGPEKRRAGFLEFFGGKFETGEDGVVCLIREAQEELGITITPDCIYEQWETVSYTYPDEQTVILHPILCRISSTSGFSPREYGEWMWLDVDELASWKDQFLAADWPIVDKLTTAD